MLTGYEQHLYEILGKTQQQLKEEVSNSAYLKSKNKDLEAERNRYREYWIESSNKVDRLEKELKATKEKEEQNAATSYSPITKALTSGLSIVKASTDDVKEAV